MRWKRGRGRGQIEDRRGSPGFPGIAVGGGGVGILGLLVYLMMNGVLGGGAAPGGGPTGPDPDAELVDFLGFVVDDVQDHWADQFAEAGLQYDRTTLVIFDQATTSGCGPASSATGPFYCPADRKLYLDLGFFRELSQRFGAPGDFAQAYVIAHEFGHHVQTLNGTDRRVREAQRRDPSRENELSIRLELQADCLAGVWGHSAAEEGLLEPGDLREGLDAAAAIGDDRLQREGGGRVNRETWTHGSSAQRVRWFETGFRSGDPDDCTTI
jgi:uncharacterized protein